MSAKYPPGTVAVATVRGLTGVRVFRRRRSGWTASGAMNGWEVIPDVDVTDVRPLVVLDLAYEHTALDVAHALREEDFDWVADQIEEQIRPPKQQVYSHVVGSRHPSADGSGKDIIKALCGKVWQGHDPESVEVVGRCPECSSLAQEWSA